ncbi:MAG TPA: hydrolase 1, exosortase A system-associated [Aquabacterium sp.]|uniref:hydrolase 1, exosortase A system-associated n=1 Tax=Aquabacterium sp. TaxID=1872578 RepID=UPI002E33FEF6|nr:hydrolase 1, exosortase A system-associated [Aquabacterium sp.]HEX5354573.1 hydrolase 1, exosortase A system-associated [Aquabacterium sp.]
MKHEEHAFLFDCAGAASVGIVSLPVDASAADTGLLIVVGGPQYRVGSHRLFVKLARHAAAEGLAAMRFDYRGMGDSWAAQQTFESVDADLKAAIDAFMQQVPSLKRVVIWGLCDGATAACFYAPKDKRVGGLILVNPWVHTPEGAADTRLKHYFLRRLLSGELWHRILVQRRLPKISAFKVLLHALSQSVMARIKRLFGRRAPQSEAAMPLPERTGHQVVRAGLRVALALSEDDKIAREFEDQAMPTAPWRQIASTQLIELAHLEHADHTVTAAPACDRLCALTVTWVRSMAA